MCIDGHVIKLESETLNEIKRLMGIAGNNLNQLAQRANSGGEVYREDIAGISSQFTEIRLCFGEALTFLSVIADAKPGNQFIKPLTIRDLPEYSVQSTKAEGE